MRIVNLPAGLMLALLMSGGVVPSLGQGASGGREGALIPVLTSDAAHEAKAAACRELAHVGTAEAVPALAALLADEKLADLARYGLEPIPGPAVDAALRDALGTLKGRLLAGVICSLGVRRDAKAIPGIAACLNDPDADIARAAALALGRIGTTDAVTKLQAALAQASGAHRGVLCDSLLRCAEAFASCGRNDMALAIYTGLRILPEAPSQVRDAALRGAILANPQDGLSRLLEAIRSDDYSLVLAAGRISAALQDAGVTKALVEELEKGSVDKQILLSQLLGKRRDATALPALFRLAKAGDQAVRLAALNSAAEIGHGAVAPLLIELLNDPDKGIAQAAENGLVGLVGTDVDDALLSRLGNPDPAMKIQMINLVGQRRLMKAIPLLQNEIAGSSGPVRMAAIAVYGNLAGMPELPWLLERIVVSKDATELAALEKGLGAICSASADPAACVRPLVAALARSTPEAKPAVVRKLRVVGGPEALMAVRGAVDDTNADVHAAAIRALGEWKTADAIPLLRDLAKKSADPAGQLASLRSYLDLASRSEFPAQDRLAICRDAAPLIQRADEKRMLLGFLGAIGDAGSLDLVLPMLDDAAVKEEAIATVLTIAEKRAKKQHTEAAHAALQTVVRVAADKPAVVKRAEELLMAMTDER